MKICDLPVSFISSSGKVRILLMPVGLKLPAAFNSVAEALVEIMEGLELDVASVCPDYLNITGQIKYSFSTCENHDALEFLLGINDEFLPHLDYHVVVGAAVAESQKDLIDSSNNFEEMVKKANRYTAPCLFVFSAMGYTGGGLPMCATQIPANSEVGEIKRRVREGFVRCLMEYLLTLRSRLDELSAKPETATTCLTLGSASFLLGGYKKAAEYYERALKYKAESKINAMIFEQSLNKHIKIQYDKSLVDTAVPAPLSELAGTDLQTELLTAITLALKSKNSVIISRILLRLAPRVDKKYQRKFIIAALSFLKKKTDSKSGHYRELALLLLKHVGLERTFMYETAMACQHENAMPFILRPFAATLTSGSNWTEQRINPAAALFESPSVPRAIKNDLMQYLLEFIHTVNDAQRQRELLSLIPSHLTVPCETLLRVGALEPQEEQSPLEEESSGGGNRLFIFNALEKQRRRRLVCAVGDQLSFTLAITNPLQIVFPVHVCQLDAENGNPTPVVFALPPKRQQVVPMCVTAARPGKLIVRGFTLISGSVTAEHRLSDPIIFDVTEKMPTLNVRLPFRMQPRLFENSENEVAFEIINSSDVAVTIKGIKFPPTPNVATPTSLPIAYPPEVVPPLPPEIGAGDAFSFKLRMVADRTLPNLSFVVEYGPKGYIRRFNYSQELEIAEGPHVDRLQVVPMDDHDDFKSVSHLLMVVIKNPFELPIEVDCDTEASIVVAARSYGTLLVRVDRIELDIDPNAQTWCCPGIDREHVRKCETTLIKELNRPLTAEEKVEVWSTLQLKMRLQEQLHLRWASQDGLGGPIPFNHVDIDRATLLLMQPPPIAVKFEMERATAKQWRLRTAIEGDGAQEVRVCLSFAVENAGPGVHHVLTAGLSEHRVKAPAEIETYLHCAAVGTLVVTGKFYIGEGYFVRRGSFILANYQL